MPFAFFVPHHVCGCSVSLRSLSYCLQLRLIPHGSSCVLHSPSLNRSFITFHSTSFADPTLLQCLASWSTHKPPHSRMHMHFRKPTHIAHWVPLHCIQSGFVQSCSVPPAATLFCSPAAPSGCVCCVLLIAPVVPPVRKAAHQRTCIRPPPAGPSGNLCRRLPM
jgi:hypothetical protein